MLIGLYRHTALTIYSEEDDDIPSEKLEKSFPPKFLGVSPCSNEKTFLKNGPYGYYVLLGEDRERYTSKRASIAERNGCKNGFRTEDWKILADVLYDFGTGLEVIFPLCLHLFMEMAGFCKVDPDDLGSSVYMATKGRKVAIKIVGSNPEEQQKMFGQHFEKSDELVSHITRRLIDILKAEYWDDLSIEEQKL